MTGRGWSEGAREEIARLEAELAAARDELADAEARAIADIEAADVTPEGLRALLDRAGYLLCVTIARHDCEALTDDDRQTARALALGWASDEITTNAEGDRR